MDEGVCRLHAVLLKRESSGKHNTDSVFLYRCMVSRTKSMLLGLAMPCAKMNRVPSTQRLRRDNVVSSRPKSTSMLLE